METCVNMLNLISIIIYINIFFQVLDPFQKILYMIY